jgi:hypothetical protein
MQTNCQAIAKLVTNKKLNTVRLVVTFDLASERVTVRNAAYVSGDLCDANDSRLEQCVSRALSYARDLLRTNNIRVV